MKPALESSLLRILRRASAPIPLADLADELRTSPAALGEVVASLESMGFALEQHPHLGLTLLSSPAHLTPADIQSRLEHGGIAWHIRCHSSLRSTNDETLRLGEAQAPAFTAVFAEHQTQGRGRLRREWHSGEGLGLWFSILLRPEFPVANWPRLTLWAAAAAARAIESCTGLQAGIKWPNDIQIRGKKVCGILLESRISGNTGFVAAGIGLNVSHAREDFPDDLRESATSIAIETGRAPERAELAAALLGQLAYLYPAVTGDFGSILEAWRSRSTLTGERVTVESHGSRTAGFVQDIGPEGELLLRTDDGKLLPIHQGEATLAGNLR